MQHFKREADEAAAWMAEKMQIACDESYKDPTNLSVRSACRIFIDVTILVSLCIDRESYKNTKHSRLKWWLIRTGYSQPSVWDEVQLISLCFNY